MQRFNILRPEKVNLYSTDRKGMHMTLLCRTLTEIGYMGLLVL